MSDGGWRRVTSLRSTVGSETGLLFSGDAFVSDRPLIRSRFFINVDHYVPLQFPFLIRATQTRRAGFEVGLLGFGE